MIRTLCLFVVMLVLSAASVHAVTGVHALRSYPHRSARNVNVLTSIGISYNEALDSSALETGSISVTGSTNGAYSGSLTLSVDCKTLIFQPSHPFLAGETISVYARSLRLAGGDGSTSPEAFTFATAARPTPRVTNPEITSQPLSIPDTGNLPKIYVTKNVKPYPGEIYFSNIFDPNGIGYRIRVNTDGKITFAKRTSGFATDYKANPNGTYSWVNYWAGHAYISDQSDKIIDSVSGKNGFPLDIHEFRFTPEGNYMIIADDVVDTDMSQLIPGGNTHAAVTFPVIQITDKKHNLIFEWNTKDYFNISDGTHQNFLAAGIDFSHMNSLEFDADSNIIASNRNMDEITKIDRHTGDIIWRLGGNNDMFTYKNDKYGFSGQHHFRRLPNGNFTGFDDGNFRPGPLPFSRAIEYNLDQENHVATEIWEFRHIPDRFASGMGSVQRLPNGNTLIGWGFADTVGATEVDSLGNTQFELNFGTGTHSYRVYKFDSNYITSASRAAVISAEDLDFGSVAVGDTVWKSLKINNLGATAFNLQSSYILSNTYNFFVDPKVNFPLEIKAGSSVTLAIYFNPHVIQSYSDSIIWSTDITDYQNTIKPKDRTFLKGQGTTKSLVKSSFEDNPFTISPNPVSGNFVTITGSFPESTISISDILGKEVYRLKISDATDLQIPIQHLPDGVYFVKVVSANGSYLTRSFSRVK